jgi:hypothetical protein
MRHACHVFAVNNECFDTAMSILKTRARANSTKFYCSQMFLNNGVSRDCSCQNVMFSESLMHKKDYKYIHETVEMAIYTFMKWVVLYIIYMYI